MKISNFHKPARLMPNKDDKIKPLKPQTKYFWLATRDGEPCGSFDTRREAIKWLKELIAQTQKDLDKQDKSDEYTYNIDIKNIKIIMYHNREDYLGV